MFDHLVHQMTFALQPNVQFTKIRGDTVENAKLLAHLMFFNLSIGCFIGQHCLNNILYADDICCIAPSCKGLQKLLDVCYE